MLGIEFNNKHSWKDFKLTIKSKEIGFPTPNLITDTVPFLNGVYDFSELYDEVSYGERKLTYVFNIVGIKKRNMNLLKIKVANWLRTKEKQILKDDSIIGYYFLAQNADMSFKEDGFIGELTVEFNCYPFKLKNEYEGKLLWDTFCFETDVLQQTEIDVLGATEIILYNVGSKKIIPMIECSNRFEIIKNNITYTLDKGTTKDYRFCLDIGENKLILKGNGSIKFLFRQEVL